MQISLNRTINIINNFILDQNKNTKLLTSFLHTYVHRMSGSNIRYFYSKLVDGVHQSNALAEVWIKNINKTMLFNEKKLFPL